MSIQEQADPTISGVVATRACPSCAEPLEGVACFCTRCGAEVGEESTCEAPAKRETASEAAAHIRAISCTGCGAEVAFPAGSLTARCPFCGSNAVKDVPEEAEGAPEFVLGFAVGREQAEAAYRAWLGRGRLFAPGDLRRAARLEELRGVYVPAWSFSALAVSTYGCQIGEYWYRTETYTVMVNGKPQTRTRQVRETEWYDFGGSYESWKSGYLVSASRGLPQRELDAISPYDVVALRRYSPEYLAGWVAESPSIGREEALEIGKGEFRRRQEAEIVGQLPGDTHRALSAETTFSRVADDLIHVPTWIAAYRYGGKVHRFLVNGQTGKITGTRPISALRVTVFVLVILAVVAGTIALIAAL